jgi:tmRNA-binding protein
MVSLGEIHSLTDKVSNETVLLVAFRMYFQQLRVDAWIIRRCVEGFGREKGKESLLGFGGETA